MTAEKATAQEATRKVAFAKVLAIQIIAYVVLVALALVPGMDVRRRRQTAAVPVHDHRLAGDGRAAGGVQSVPRRASPAM